MTPDSGGICMGVDQKIHQFAPGLPQGWFTAREWGDREDDGDGVHGRGRLGDLIPHNSLIKYFQKVNFPTKPTTSWFDQ